MNTDKTGREERQQNVFSRDLFNLKSVNFLEYLPGFNIAGENLNCLSHEEVCADGGPMTNGKYFS